MQSILQWLKASTSGSMNASVESLRPWNIVLAALFGAQGFALLLFSSAYNMPVSVLFLTKDAFQTQLAHHTVLALAIRQLGTIDIAYFVAMYLFVAAIVRLIAATFSRSAYETGIRKSMNLFRWVEYSISAPLMLVAIAVLAGVSDLGSLFFIAVFGIMAGLSGVLIEPCLSAETKCRTMYAGLLRTLVMALPLLVVSLYIISTNVFGTVGEPAYLYWMVGTVALFFASICCNAYLIHKKKNGWSQYIYGEQWYMILSFVAQALLAWEIFAAVLHS